MSVTKTPRELQGGTVSEWYEFLSDIGADVLLIDDVNEQWARSVAIGARVRELRHQANNAPRTPIEAAALTIARGEQYDADGVKLAILSRDELAIEIEAHEVAADRAGSLAFQMLANRKDRNVTELLRPAYTAAADGMVKIRAVLGTERITLEQAARIGRGAEWLELERLHGVIVGIRKVHAQWLADGVVRNTGTRNTTGRHGAWEAYSASEFYYREPMVAYVASDIRGPFAEANLFAAAGAALRTIAEIDAEWRESPSRANDSAEQGRAFGGNPVHWDAAKEAAQAAYLNSISIRVSGS